MRIKAMRHWVQRQHMQAFGPHIDAWPRVFQIPLIFVLLIVTGCLGYVFSIRPLERQYALVQQDSMEWERQLEARRLQSPAPAPMPLPAPPAILIRLAQWPELIAALTEKAAAAQVPLKEIRLKAPIDNRDYYLCPMELVLEADFDAGLRLLKVVDKLPYALSLGDFSIHTNSDAPLEMTWTIYAYAEPA